ncbi:MAG: IPT/TIG domain-containing protein, partial [Acidobacteriales bacterium]|nr:IPT/TIG domain-containing protein [Terriglobales bacterium]
GPGLVAGASFFDPVVKGVPLTWQGGQVTYYTDQGNLSSLLPHAAADSFVADAFSRWTGVTTAAITATRAGQLGEDVSGANFYVNSDGTLVMPADLLPSAVSKPVGIMYDANGAVTDALLGSGASTLCFSNSAFEQLDNFDDEAHRLHALVIVNGACAQTANQLIDLKYRLVRALGRVLGLDWSQVNVNIFTHNPPWTQADLSGISIMHAVDPINCVPISICFPNADVPKMDDRAAISRLYPVTPDNQGQFPGKPLFAANTARVHGSVYFSRGGEAAQGMQGVNVVARWIDPATGLPSRSTVAAAVSGARFRGNAGNPVNGYEDPGGNRYDRFGSDDETIEGAFDLAGLEIPSGSSAQYQISAEALDGTWSYGIGPYITSQVTPSGSFQPVVVTVSKGEDLAQDALMLGSAVTAADGFQPTTYSEPAPLPASGEWIATLNGYGDADYFWFNGQANRSLSVQVKSLDESSVATEEKARPMIGMWALSDPPGTLASASTPAPFSSFTFGMTQLDAMLLGTTAFRVGIADARGDGRPDYAYHARILYGDTAAPRRVSALGGSPLIVTGLGFRPELKVSVGGVPVTLLSAAGGQLLFSTPAVADGLAAVVISDADGKATSTMSGAVTFGAAADDSIRLEQGSNPGTPVGIEAPNPIKVSVRSADGSTPVPGASVVFSVSPAASFSACGGATTCTLHTDESGRASSR